MNREACFAKYGTYDECQYPVCNIPKKVLGFAAWAKREMIRCGVKFIGRGVATSIVSQLDANTQALNNAISHANLQAFLSGVNCDPAPPVQFESTRSATVTVDCPMGSTGSSQTATRSESAVSYLSQGDADSKALAAAQMSATAAADALLSCIGATEYTSTQSATASCGAGTFGGDVTRTATAISLISQDDADSKATASAQAQAQADLLCSQVIYSASSTQQACCPDGSNCQTGYATAESELSQEDANAKAASAATNDANSRLSCATEIHCVERSVTITCSSGDTVTGYGNACADTEEAAAAAAETQANVDANNKC